MIEVSRDVTFVEDVAFGKSKDVDDDEEHEAPKDVDLRLFEPMEHRIHHLNRYFLLTPAGRVLIQHL